MDFQKFHPYKGGHFVPQKLFVYYEVIALSHTIGTKGVDNIQIDQLIIDKSEDNEDLIDCCNVNPTR